MSSPGWWMRGQRDVAESREAGVVVADERDVARNRERGLLERVEDADGAQVVGGEDRGRHRLPGEQRAAAAVAAVLGEAAVDDADLAVEPEPFHRLARTPRGAPRRRHSIRRERGRSGGGRGRRVLDRDLGSHQVVVGDAVAGRVAGLPVENNDRRQGRGTRDGGVVDLRGGEDEAVDPELEKALDGVLLELDPTLAGADERPCTRSRAPAPGCPLRPPRRTGCGGPRSTRPTIRVRRWTRPLAMAFGR